MIRIMKNNLPGPRGQTVLKKKQTCYFHAAKTWDTKKSYPELIESRWNISAESLFNLLESLWFHNIEQYGVALSNWLRSSMLYNH